MIQAVLTPMAANHLRKQVVMNSNPMSLRMHVIIYFNVLNGGAKKTLLLFLNQKQLYLLIDPTELSPERTERMRKYAS